VSESRLDGAGPEGTRRTRLGALKALGAAVVGGAAATTIGKVHAASAGTGAGLVLGSAANPAEDQTKLTMDGTLPAATGAFVVTAANADRAIEGNSSSIGVLGNATTGVMGVGDIGGVFSGDSAAISLNPQTFAGDAIPSTDDHLKGDLLVDADGVLWLCIADGTPGTWTAVSGGAIRLLATPQRLYDSRNPGAGGPFAGYSTRTIDVTAAGIGVPANATAIVGNLTVTETDDVGFLTAYPAGQPTPITSNLNWSGGQTIANSATVKLGDGGRISLYVERSSAQVIVDVAGYVA
jgi:hypothetical protein